MSVKTYLHSYPFLVVADRLPPVRRDDDWAPGPRGLVSAMSPLIRERHGAWIGSAGICPEEFDSFELAGMSLVPIGLSDSEFRSYYEGFSSATIWPLYHDRVFAPQFRQSWWDSYRAVNARFAETIIESAAPRAVVWIHDYHLQLVPSFVRRQRPDISIGYFSHIPFPSAGLFEQLPWREALLDGLLGADVIGFQRQTDVKNFTEVVDQLGPTGSMSDPCIVDCYPVSIDAKTVSQIAESASTQQIAQEIRAELGNPAILLLGFDKLDHANGIVERLLAYERLLDDGRLDPRCTCLLQVAVPSNKGLPSYRDLREQVERLVGRINGKFSGLSDAVVRYQHLDYSAAETVALYLAADVLLATSLKDGMNLVAKEYVCARRRHGGALVLSEFSGAADELVDAFIVNPHNLDDLAQAITAAATIDEEEASTRMDTMAETVRTYDSRFWTRRFLNVLESFPTVPQVARSVVS
ncbi:trehalose-6-phosphate synthase [Brevibacterium permense]|uniref:alpha,alpha-trehalose-phosphate synthase (UDP-forming) n=1 Tax=Brevibacterium permense TaxID=234834 RepID=UPI0021D1B119|nr:trehalose-6-phosphate synthase [Brevibacterium permense]MCU4296109.1 trehalose-6-phosphate synthase [Brevibacterium permense]